MKTCEDTCGSSPRLCAASVEGNVILQEIPKLCEDLIKLQSLMVNIFLLGVGLRGVK